MPPKRATGRKKVSIRRPRKAQAKARPKRRTAAKLKKKISLRQSLKQFIKTRRRLAPAVFKFKVPPLYKHESNPIIEPRQGNFWEMKATFNPGAVYADKRVHLLYRAIGGNDVSVLGYAASSDGIHVDERLDAPAFVPVIKPASGQRPATSSAAADLFLGRGMERRLRGSAAHPD